MWEKNEYKEYSEEIYSSLTGKEPDEFEIRVIGLKTEKIFAMLREDTDMETLYDQREIISYTIALMAALEIREKEKALYSKPVKIGDITMESSVGSEGLRALINACLRDLAPILRDDKFIFKLMDGE